MKTPDSTPKITGLTLPQILKTFGLLFLLGSLASCSTPSKSSQATFEPNHWHKVSNNPPTYFPKGVPANQPTGENDGTWVLTGDESLSSYFVPSHGVATKSLIAEAHTMTSESAGADLGGSLGSAFGIGALGFGKILLERDRHIRQTTGRAAKGGAIANAGYR